MGLPFLRAVTLALCCGASAATGGMRCGDAKMSYRQSRCCGNPDNIMEVPEEDTQNATPAAPTLAPPDMFPGAAPILMNFGEVCPVEPQHLPTDGWYSLVPNASLRIWTDYTLAPEECRTACFSPDCFGEMPAHCCEPSAAQGGASLDMLPYFSKTNVVPMRAPGPASVGNINLIVTGACSADGELFYGEACGAMTFGPFRELGLGPCEKPKDFSACLGVIKTRQPGCFRVESLPGPMVVYLKVHDDVCSPNTFETDPFGVPVGMAFQR